jgi:hypothetical protein
MAGRARCERDWLLRDPPAQGPQLSTALDLERGGPRQRRRAQLGAQARRSLPGQLRVTGRPAASSAARSSTCSDGRASQASPSCAARRPEISAPKMPAAAAASAPARPASRPKWPPPGCSPIRRKPLISRASSATMRRSVASIRLIPAPTAAPRTAAMVGHLQLADPGEGPVDTAEGGVPALLYRVAADLVQVAPLGSGAERAVGAPDDRGSDRGVPVHLVTGRDELPGQLVVERIPGRGCVEGDEGDAIGDVEVNHRLAPRLGSGGRRHGGVRRARRSGRGARAARAG